MAFFGATKARIGEVDVITAARPPIKSATLAASPIKVAVKSHMDEYAELASSVGVKLPDLGIEAFKAFLEKKDIPVFSLSEVIIYMDKKAASESKEKSGWEWRPLREKDNRDKLNFGTAPKRGRNEYGQVINEKIEPGSDFYRGPFSESSTTHNGHPYHRQAPASSLPYDRPIPLHALRKVALIEKEYSGDAAFFVTDYALAPQIEYPDPFLMVVVPNIDINKGVGRFVIDFWDEPGFGLDKQLA